MSAIQTSPPATPADLLFLELPPGLPLGTTKTTCSAKGSVVSVYLKARCKPRCLARQFLVAHLGWASKAESGFRIQRPGFQARSHSIGRSGPTRRVRCASPGNFFPKPFQATINSVGGFVCWRMAVGWVVGRVWARIVARTRRLGWKALCGRPCSSGQPIAYPSG